MSHHQVGRPDNHSPLATIPPDYLHEFMAQSSDRKQFSEKNRSARWLRTAVGVGTGVTLLAGSCVAEAPRPNIIYVLADDMGYGDAGFNGQTVIQTPALDQMANEGVVFTQHYAGCAMCAPSRGCLHTGMHTGHCSIPTFGYTFRPEDITVAEVLSSAGYECHHFGKYGGDGAFACDERAAIGNTNDTDQLAPYQSYGLPGSKGFDFSLSYLNHATAHYYFPQHLWQVATGGGAQKTQIAGNYGVAYGGDYRGSNFTDTTINRTTYAHDVIHQAALDVITNSTGATPFYLQCSYTLPHRETIAPPGYDPLAGSYSRVDAAYAAMIQYLDMSVGEILAAVSGNASIRDNTLIIFTSDNGPQFTDGHSEETFNSNGDLRGRKFTLYEGGIRSPFVAHWPGKIPAGRVSDHASAFCDFLPTAAELAGVPAPSGIDGLSYVASMTGEGTQVEHDYLFWQYFENATLTDPRYVIRMGDWKYLKNGNGTERLFDLATNPSENDSYNQLASQPAIADQMRDILTNELTGMVPVERAVLALDGEVTYVSSPPTGSEPAVTSQTRAYYRFDQDNAVAGDPVVTMLDQNGPGNRNGTGEGSTTMLYSSEVVKPLYACDAGTGRVPLSGDSNHRAVDLIAECGQYLSVPYSADLTFGDSSFTLEAWVCLDEVASGTDAGNRRWLAFKKGLNTSDALMDYGWMANIGDLVSVNLQGKTTGHTGREIALLFGNGSENWGVVSQFEIADDDWHYVSVAFDAENDTVRFVLDQQSETVSITDLGHSSPANSPLVFGAHHNSAGDYNQFLDGRLDEIRVSAGVVAENQLLGRPANLFTEPTVYRLDFGDLWVDSTPVSKQFRVLNGAAGYANMMGGGVQLGNVTDPRLNVTTGTYPELVDGQTSQWFEVELTPDQTGPIENQYLTVTGNTRIWNSPANNAPVVLQIVGNIIEEPTGVNNWDRY